MHSEQTKIKISKAMIGNKSAKGFIHPKESRDKMRLKALGNKKGLGNKGNRGSKPIEWRRRMSEMRKGNKTHLWKGGITPINQSIRRSFEYKLWRESVFKRDNWTCRFCFVRGGNLEADHIKPFALFPELRFAIDNGRTLCKECHRKTDSYGRNKLTQDQMDALPDSGKALAEIVKQ